MSEMTTGERVEVPSDDAALERWAEGCGPRARATSDFQLIGALLDRWRVSRTQAATDRAEIERLTAWRAEAEGVIVNTTKAAVVATERAEAAEAQVAALAGEVEALVEAANALLDGREGAVANLQRCIDATLSTTAPEPCGGIGDDITLDPVRLLSDDLRNEEA